MQYHKFSFPYDELFPESRELYNIIGSNEDDGTFSLVAEDSEIIRKEITAGSVAEGGFFITSDFSIDLNDKSFRALNKKFYPGKIILSQLKRSSAISFFICTAGYSISNYSKDCLKNGNLLRAYIADMSGSLIVEKCMDKGEEVLMEMLYKNNLKITNRFSPGYCGWNTEEQHKLFSLFTPGFCGVTLTESALMQPIKSISGVIGIGENVKKRDYTCSYCNDLECFYRRE